MCSRWAIDALAAAGPSRPNFDLHSLWYQSSTALPVDKTRRRTEKKKRFGEQHICSRTWGIRGTGKKSVYIYPHQRQSCGKTLIFLFLPISFFGGSERSNMELTPHCQSWHVIQRNTVMNAKRHVQWAESSTGAVLKPVYGIPANTLSTLPTRKRREGGEEGWIKSLGKQWNGANGVTSRSCFTLFFPSLKGWWTHTSFGSTRPRDIETDHLISPMYPFWIQCYYCKDWQTAKT